MESNLYQTIFRVLLGAFMLYAGVGHLGHLRQEFRAQVPKWLATQPKYIDFVVLVSGIVEIALGLAMIFWVSQSVKVGLVLALFFLVIFPGNIAQYLNRTAGFGLDTDKKRLLRLVFQPVLIVLALWSTGALEWILR
jgi:uncharacterized membrane protein